MLQQIRDSLGRWVFGAILALIALSFVFWGVDFDLTGPSYAAQVNGEEIALSEFQRDLQFEQNRFQEQYRVELDRDVRRQIRRTVIDRLVRQEALAQRVQEQGYAVSDERLSESIRSIPAFQVGGQFSMEAYRGQLSLQGLSPSAFEAVQREQLALMDLQRGVASSAFLTPYEYRRYVELANQRRLLGYALFESSAFADDVQIGEDEIAAHYEENAGQYMTEEAAAIEYVELSLDDIAAEIEVTESELEDYYASMRDQLTTEEERRASHILITPEPGESDEETRERAEAVLERIEAGEDFETLAGEVSDDPGTASEGGDLGWISRGMLAGPFEDTLYEMEIGEIAGPVETDFGYHIIRLDAIRAGDEPSFAEMRDELLEQHRAERAEARFFDRANELSDAAFDAYDELASVAEQLDLELKRLDRYPRSGDPEAFPNNGPVVDAVFGPEAEVGLNSDLLELTDEHVAVVRVIERFPPEQRPLEEVEDQIREELTRRRTEELAAEAAAEFEGALPEPVDAAFIGAADEGGGDDGDGAEESDAGQAPAAELAAEHSGEWNAPRWIQRSDPSLPGALVARAFGLPEPEPGMPAHARVELSGGNRAVVFLAGVEPGNPGAVTADERDSYQQQLIDQIVNGELGGYTVSVSESADVVIPDDVLEPQF